MARRCFQFHLITAVTVLLGPFVGAIAGSAVEEPDPSKAQPVHVGSDRLSDLVRSFRDSDAESEADHLRKLVGYLKKRMYPAAVDSDRKSSKDDEDKERKTYPPFIQSVADSLATTKRRLSGAKAVLFALEEIIKKEESSRDRLELEAAKIIARLLEGTGQASRETDPWAEYKRLRKFQKQGGVEPKRIRKATERLKNLKAEHEAAVNNALQARARAAVAQSRISELNRDIANVYLDLKIGLGELTKDFQAGPRKIQGLNIHKERVIENLPYGPDHGESIPYGPDQHDDNKGK